MSRFWQKDLRSRRERRIISVADIYLPLQLTKQRFEIHIGIQNQESFRYQGERMQQHLKSEISNKTVDLKIKALPGAANPCVLACTYLNRILTIAT
jgi:hypothetical protein